MNWHVYHYRGKLIQSFASKDEAADFIAKQKIPTEYYWEYEVK